MINICMNDAISKLSIAMSAYPAIIVNTAVKDLNRPKVKVKIFSERLQSAVIFIPQDVDSK